MDHEQQHGSSSDDDDSNRVFALSLNNNACSAKALPDNNHQHHHDNSLRNNNTSPASSTALLLLSDTQSVISAAREEQDNYKPLIPIEEDPTWERIRTNLSTLLPQQHNYLESYHFGLLRNIFIAGIRDYEVLKSVACLGACFNHDNSRVIGEQQGQDPLTSTTNINNNYDQHVMTIARCLSRPPRMLRKSAKLACLRALMTLLTPLEAGWQLHDRVIQDSLRFITERTYEWEYFDHSHELLLWELRAMCLHDMELRQHQISEKVAQGGDVAAELIVSSARCVEWGLDQSTVVLTTGIVGAGDKLKGLIKPEDVPLLEANLRAKVVALAYSDYARRATDGARETSFQAMERVSSVSAKGIHKVANRFQNDKFGERIVPHEQSREIITAVGKVSIAAVGGAAIVADSLVKSTRTVAQTTAAVTADLVHYKYGASAGQLVRNSSDTVGNVFRTVGHVTLMQKGSAMANSVTRETGKIHLKYLNEQSLMYPSDSDDDDDDDDDDGCYMEAKVWHEEPIELNEATMRQFDTHMSISPQELDSVLPDEISTNDAQSDFFFSDITHDRDDSHCYRHLLRRQDSSSSSVFRELLDESFNTTTQMSPIPQEADAFSIMDHCTRKQYATDDSLEYTACTVEESLVTNDSILDQEGECTSAISISHPYDIPPDMYYDNSSRREPLASYAFTAADAPQQHASMHFNRIPPNGYVYSDNVPSTNNRGGALSDWPKGLYSSIKSRLHIHN